MLPSGPKVALTGGLDFNDHHLIWDRLGKVHAKHPDMVLIHGSSPKGAELIASKWATCACRKSIPDILMMQSAQHWPAKNVPGSVNGAPCRRAFVQR
jgi:SLOG family YspA-like protein